MSTSNNISEKRHKKLLEFQQKYNLNFSNINLLNQAFCHTSYTNENNIGIENSYERLEFLGDAVLKLSISSLFYNIYSIWISQGSWFASTWLSSVASTQPTLL